MRIGEPARNHQVADEDIWHAYRNAIWEFPAIDDMTIFTGPARDGALLEIGVLDLHGEDPVILHAMPARPQFIR